MMKSCDIQRRRREGSIAAIVLLIIWIIFGSLVAHAEEDSKALCRQELLEMMRNTDSSWHDVAEWNLKAEEVNEIWWDLIDNEGYLDYNSYDLIYVTFKLSNGYVTSMALVGLDDEYALRYASIQNHINVVQEATKNMSDLEKVLFVNEYIEDITYYTYVSDHEKYRACGPLYNGYAVCEGYSEAVRLLLRSVDIPVTYVSSVSMKHKWILVQIDGEWYHMDSTWDDAKGQNGTDTKHTYFLRNDNEYINNLPTKHYNWIVDKMKVESTSTLYSNWFVHDIRGKMHYYDGLWYYIDSKTGDIVRSGVDLAQSDYEVMVDKDAEGISNLSINRVENNTLYYAADGVAYEKALQSENTGLDWSDASYWRSGHYSMLAGKYQAYEGRICLQDYLPIQAEKAYQVQISDENYRVLIRELDAQHNNVGSWNLSNSNTLITSSTTEYLAVSIYSQSINPTYEEYCTMFDNGMTVRLVEADMIDVNETSNWDDEKYWRSGCYLPDSGCYTTYQTRICLLDYNVVENGAYYEVRLSNSKYHMLVSEMTKEKEFINSHDLANKEYIKLSPNTEYVAISVYNANNEWMEYETYLAEMNSGIEIGFIKRNDIVDELVNVNDTLIWNQAKYWRSGQYSMISGLYKDCYPTRVCLLDYISIDNTRSYEVVLPDDKYHMLIREMTVDKSFISSHNLVDGDTFIPSEDTAYLAISLYMPAKDNSASFNDYLAVIESGVGLEITDVTENISLLSLDEDALLEEETTEEETTEEETTEEETTEEETTEEETTEEETTEEETTEEETAEEESTEEETTEEETTVEETTEEETTEEETKEETIDEKIAEEEMTEKETADEETAEEEKTEEK